MICAGTVCVSVTRETNSIGGRNEGEANGIFVCILITVVCLGLWVFYTINGFGISLLLTLLKGLNYLTNKDDIKETEKCYIPLFFQVYFLGLVLISVVNTKVLKRWIFNNVLKTQYCTELALREAEIIEADEELRRREG